MNESSQQLWSNGELDSSNGAASLNIPEEDFAALFSTNGDFSLDLSNYDFDDNGLLQLGGQGASSTTSNSTPGDSGFDMPSSSKDLDVMTSSQQRHSHSHIHTHLGMSLPHTTAPSQATAMALDFENHRMFDTRGQGNGGQHQRNQERRHHVQQQQQRTYGGMIPPTPSSMELQANASAHTSHYMDQAFILDSLHGLKDDPMIFTPLVSPAVGPLGDSNYTQLQDFSIPTAFLSPMTSPALEEPHANMMRLPRSREQSFSESTSPVDPRDNNVPPPNLTVSGAGRGKAMNARSAPSRVVRQSPSMKPQKKKAPPPQLLSTPEIADAALAGARVSTPRSSTYQGGLNDVLKMTLPDSSRASSSADSISPEPVSDILMPPPPPKNKAMAQPEGGDDVAKRAKRDSKDAAANPKKPQNGVTPAQLMKMNPTSGSRDKGGDTPMGEATVTVEGSDKDVANGKARPVAKDGQDEEQQTPRLSYMKRKSPATSTATIRPRVGGMPGDSMSMEANRGPGGPPTPIASSGVRLPPGPIRTNIQPAAHARRGSTTLSPALQPRLSPAMKPLLPGGAQNPALYLASRSNYENLVAGTHSQLGLTYPESLSANLTSKKTSHKIAEKGRRNRINNALSEIASLLPRSNPAAAAPTSTSGGEQSPTDDASATARGSSKSPPTTPQMTASKASTVENAILYIKTLQKQLSDTQARLAAAEAEIKTFKDAQK